MPEDLLKGLRQTMAAVDGDRERMYAEGRAFLMANSPHPQMLKAVAEFGRIMWLDWGPKSDQEPWRADR